MWTYELYNIDSSSNDGHIFGLSGRESGISGLHHLRRGFDQRHRRGRTHQRVFQVSQVQAERLSRDDPV